LTEIPYIADTTGW